jgi:hypothetical protein
VVEQGVVLTERPKLRQMAKLGRPRLPRTNLAVAVAVVLALAAAALFVISSGPGSTPPGQPPLVSLADISRFDADFDAACSHERGTQH